jgi:hypothetical protein
MTLLNTRSCLPCTACCEGWLDVQGPVANAQLGVPCQHCSQAGCRIYTSRPIDPCRNFACAWRQPHTPLPDEMRPDICGAIVMFDYLTWQGNGIIVAVATGSCMPKATFQWLQGLAAIWQKNLLTIEFEQDNDVYTGDYQMRMIGPDAFKRDMTHHFTTIDAARWVHRRQKVVPLALVRRRLEPMGVAALP